MHVPGCAGAGDELGHTQDAKGVCGVGGGGGRGDVHRWLKMCRGYAGDEHGCVGVRRGCVMHVCGGQKGCKMNVQGTCNECGSAKKCAGGES